jgi:hypothetical protein
MRRRRRHRAPLAVEQLEDRSLLAVSAVSLANAAPPPGLVADTAGGTSSNAVVSLDGRWVAYQSTAPNLVMGQVKNNSGTDVFLFDRLGLTTTLVSHAASSASATANASSTTPQISGDGRFIVYESGATNLVAGENNPNGIVNVFVFDRTTGANTLVTASAPSTTVSANGPSMQAVISQDGNYIAYTTSATDVGSAITDNNGATDIYLYRRTDRMLQLVSHSTTSITTTGNAASDNPSINQDGSTVAFRSDATDVAAGVSISNNASNVYVFNRTGSAFNPGGTLLVSRNALTTTLSASGDSRSPVLSDMGRYVAFTSTASNVVLNQAQTTAGPNVFLFDQVAQTNALASGTAGSPTNTGDGRSDSPSLSTDLNFTRPFVAFRSDSTNLVQGATTSGSNVFVFDPNTQSTALVSHAIMGTTIAANGASDSPAISDDGSTIVFRSLGTNLLTGQVKSPTNSGSDVYVANRASRVVSLASRNQVASAFTGNAPSSGQVVSGDGRFVAFGSSATDLVAGKNVTNGFDNIFLYDQQTLNNIIVSQRDATLPSATAGGTSSVSMAQGTSFSTDGRFLTFTSTANNILPGQVDPSRVTDVFLFDRQTRTYTLVSHAAGAATTAANGDSSSPLVSSDGRYVAFLSTATNLVAGQAGPAGTNAFLFDRMTGTTTLISHAPGAAATAADGSVTVLTLSGDGNVVAFVSNATTQVNAESNPSRLANVYLFNRTTGAIALLSGFNRSPTNVANAISDSPAVNTDGTIVAFRSDATNLVPNVTDANNASDVFLFNAMTGTLALVSHAAGAPTVTANLGSDSPAVSADGTTVAFVSFATNLVDGQSGGGNFRNVFFYDRSSGLVTLVSHSTAGPKVAGNAASFGGFDPLGRVPPAISSDGGFIAFASFATNLVTGQVDVNNASDVFLFSRTGGAVTLVSGTAVSTTNTGNAASSSPTISNDGRSVAFVSSATNLVSGQTGTAGASNVFVFDRLMGTRTLVSAVPSSATTTGNDNSSNPVLSGDGGFVAFNSAANNLVPQDYNGAQDVFLFQFNRAPTDILLSNNTVPNASTPGTTVGTLTAVDPDASEPQASFTFALVSGAGSGDNGAFTISGNTLLLAVTTSFRQQPSYTIRVRTTDPGGLFFEKAFIINVQGPSGGGPNKAPLVQTVGTFDPSTGNWYLRNSNNAGPANVGPFAYGLPGWEPVMGSWNGSGLSTVGVVDPSGFINAAFAVWFLRNENSPGPADFASPFIFGLRTWVPVVGDWTGTGHTGIGMFDPATGIWYLKNDPGAGSTDFVPFQFGLPGWIPVVGDWTGSGHAGIGVVDPTTGLWYLRNTVGPGLPDFGPFAYGLPGWTPVTGDWSGSGHTGIGMVDPGGVWYLRNSPGAGPTDFATFAYGLGGWKPVSGDYDFPAQPQRAAGGRGQGGAAAALGDDLLQAAVGQALARLAAAGVDAALLGRLAQAHYEVASLPGSYLGLTLTASDEVLISADAAGYGWYADASAASDAQFLSAGPGAALLARPGSAAAGHQDLLTVVLHEMGHLAGRPDVGGAASGDDLMAQLLAPGVRRVDALDSVFASEL